MKRLHPPPPSVVFHHWPSSAGAALRWLNGTEDPLQVDFRIQPEPKTRRDPPLLPSYFEGVVLDVPQQRLWEWKLLGAVRVSVEDQPCEVLQGGEAVGLVDGPLQFQHHGRALNGLRAGFGRALLLQPPLVCFVFWSHVVLHQAGHVGERGEAGPGRGAGVQEELGAAVLDAYAGGTAGGPDRQRQHVERVAAVTDQKRPFRSLLQRSVGLGCCHGPPVPSCADTLL